VLFSGDVFETNASRPLGKCTTAGVIVGWAVGDTVGSAVEVEVGGWGVAVAAATDEGVTDAVGVSVLTAVANATGVTAGAGRDVPDTRP